MFLGSELEEWGGRGNGNEERGKGDRQWRRGKGTG